MIDLPAPDGTGPDDPRLQVFVSYSRKDREFSRTLVTALVAHQFAAYLDERDIAPGEPWQDRLAELIAKADTVIFLIFPHSIGSPICQWEIEEAERLHKRILPIVRRTVSDSSVPRQIRRLNYMFLTEAS